MAMARIRERECNAGNFVWTKRPANSYTLPEGLPDHVRVKVISNHYRTAVVEYQGKTFQVSDRCLDNGNDIEVQPGRWEIYRLGGRSEPLAKWRDM